MRRRALSVCAKSGCPTLTMNSYCDKHRPKAWSGSHRKDSLTLSGSQLQKRRRRILSLYLNCCHVCGGIFPDDELDVDHVVPLSQGGEDTAENCRPICKPDHKLKTQAEMKLAKATVRPG